MKRQCQWGMMGLRREKFKEMEGKELKGWRRN